MKSMLDDMPDDLKMLFKKSWGMECNFDYVKDAKVITTAFKKESIDDGTHVTKASFSFQPHPLLLRAML
jgi:hypothetical protein